MAKMQYWHWQPILLKKHCSKTALQKKGRSGIMQITEAVITGQEQERTELGEELHDNINQILASTKLYIECAMKDKNPRMDLIAESKALVRKSND